MDYNKKAATQPSEAAKSIERFNNTSIVNQFESDNKKEIKEPYLPESLKEHAEKPFWVCFALEIDCRGKTRKIPINPHTGKKASISDPSTWGTFKQAVSALRSSINDCSSQHELRYLAIALNEKLGIITIDLDDVYEPQTKTLETFAKDIVDKCNTYTELSQSGRGLHIYGYGVKKTKKCRKGHLEVYDSNRFMIVTNNPYIDNKPLRDINDAVYSICEEHGLIDNFSESSNIDMTSSQMSDETIIAKALKAKNGNKFRSLFNEGDVLGYQSLSEADAALCGILAFWTKDPEQIERLWQKSSIWRDKGEKRKDYVELTIRNALKINSNCYQSCNINNTSNLPENKKERLILPGKSQTISSCAKQAGSMFSRSGSFFLKGGSFVEVENGIVNVIKPAQFCSEIESIAEIFEADKKGEIINAILTEGKSKLILASKVFKKELPSLNLISKCPVLIRNKSGLVVVEKYDRGSGILVMGGRVQKVSLDQAVQLILSLVEDFRFASEGDKSRAIADLITPELTLGDILDARIPLDVIEANKSQAGKGYLLKVKAAIYNDRPMIVTQKKGGVGSLEETFNACLIKGHPFISFDNIRGKIDLPALESFMTEDSYPARIPFSETMNIDPKKYILSLTSNKGEMTEDLANRSSIIRIIKQSEGYQYKEYSEGSLLDHVRVNQGLYLGAVFAIVDEWHKRGCKFTSETRHDFRKWCRCLDWIVQNIFGLVPLMDEHKETQNRVTNLNLNWLRDVGLIIIQSSKKGEWIRANDLLDLIEDKEIEIPGIKEGETLIDDGVRKKVFLIIGKKLGSCFKEQNELIIDSIKIERKTTKYQRGDGSGPQEVKEYRFTPLTRLCEAPVLPKSASDAFEGIKLSEKNK